MAVKKKVVEIDTKEAQTSVKDLRQQLKALRDTMLSVEEGTEEYNKALTQAAEITHTLKEQTEFINATAMDFGLVVGNIQGALGGMVGGLQAAKAAMNLLGVENEDVIRSLQQMQNLMALTQALPAIDKGVKAFKKLGIAIKAAAAGMNTFKKALISTGIGAAVAALGLLIVNWDKIKNAVSGANDEMKRLEALQNKIKTVVDSTNTSLEKQLNLETKIRQAFGQSDVEIAASELDFYTKKAEESTSRISGLRSELAKLNASLERNRYAGKHQSVLDGISNKIKEIEGNLKAEEAVQDELNKKVEESKQNFVLSETIQKAKDLKKAEEDATKAREEASKARQKELEDLAKAYKELVIEIANYGKSNKDLELEKLNQEEQKRIDIIKKSVKDETEALKQINAVTEHYASLRAGIEKKYSDEALANEHKKAEEELALLENNYKLETAKLLAQLDDKLISLQEFNERRKQLDETYRQDYIDLLQAQLEDETLSIEKRIELYEKLNEARVPKQDEVDKSLTDGITEAINASALALNDFSNNPAWGKVLQNVAILTANWEHLHKDIIGKDAQKAFSAYAQIAAAGLGAIATMMNGLAAEQDQSNQQGFESAKKYQIAGATMSMLAGIASAWASSMQLTFPANVIVGTLLSAMMTGIGIAQIDKIKNTQFNGGSNASGSSATPNASAVASIQAPVQYTQDVQGASIEGAIKDTRVYVTEGDISSTQKRVDVAESEARF